MSLTGKKNADIVDEGGRQLSAEVVERIRSFKGDDGGSGGIYDEHHCNVIVQRGEGITTISFRDLGTGNDYGCSFSDEDFVPRFINGVDRETGEISPDWLMPMLMIFFDPGNGFKTYEELSSDTEDASVLAAAPAALDAGDVVKTVSAVENVLGDAGNEKSSSLYLSEDVLSRIKEFLRRGRQDGVFDDSNCFFEVQERGNGNMVISFTEAGGNHLGINVLSDGKVSFVTPAEEKYKGAAADFVNSLFDLDNGITVMWSDTLST